MKVIIGNYGNETIALIQWVYEQQFENVYILSVDTGWAAENWLQRVEQGRALAESYGFSTAHLIAVTSFADLIRKRKQFPTTKTQWCAGFLKGLTLLQWLDQHDPQALATLYMGHRKQALRTPLPAIIEESEHFSARRVEHPLLQTTDEIFMSLIERSGMPLLSYRSLECDPCVNSSDADLAMMQQADIDKTHTLEQQVERPMFTILPDAGIEKTIWHCQQETKDNKNGQFSMGCGSPFACGL